MERINHDEHDHERRSPNDRICGTFPRRPTEAHAAVHTYDAGHGVKVKVWSKTGSRGDFKQVQIEQSFKAADGEGKTFTVSIPNSALPALIEQLKQANAEHIEPR